MCKLRLRQPIPPAVLLFNHEATAVSGKPYSYVHAYTPKFSSTGQLAAKSTLFAGVARGCSCRRCTQGEKNGGLNLWG